MRARTTALLLALALPTLACPAEVPQAETREELKRTPAVSPDDPRVVKDGEDLYPNPDHDLKGGPDPEEAGPGPGSGTPDETNGVCRLFAPKLPRPECCKLETGFDVATARSACGHDLYLGESFQYSCGYYFHNERGNPRWFRLSFVPGETPKEAAASHDRKMKRMAKDPSFESTPVPGVAEAYWSGFDGLNWAFLPGWEKVRLLAWRDSSCERKDITKLIKKIVGAKHPEKNAERPMIPRAL